MDKRASSTGTYNKKNIGITLGDPGGIGAEIILKTIDEKILKNVNIIVIGSYKVIERAIKLLNFKRNINLISEISQLKEKKINILDVKLPSYDFTYGKTSKINGYASFEFLKKGIKLALNGDISALVTAPISKLGLRLAGINFPGHTEILAKFTNTEKFRMLFMNDKISTILHSIHIPLKDVPGLIKKKLLIETIEIGHKFFENFLKFKPKIFVSGLNPHAGEDGLFGNEEVNEIKTAITYLRKEGLNVNGPFPPDIIFHLALKDNADLVVSMYHDQGLGPLKTLDFYGTVNITAGIPFIRTSPDHGTGFDIAWKNKANPESFKKAIKYAIKFSRLEKKA